MSASMQTPDWPPRSSASDHPEGHKQNGSTGQLWQVRSGQWVRIEKPTIVRRLTEQEWRDLDDLRKHWAAFCDADPVPEDFIYRMERAGFAQLRKVRKADLEKSFAAERGIEKGGMLWELTRAGHEAIAESASEQSKG